MTYAARTRYDRPGRAKRYAGRSPRRSAEEAALLLRLLARLPSPPADALDAPCGTGRIARILLERGIPTRAADLSAAMRAEAWKELRDLPGLLGVLPLDLESPEPDPTLASDLVVCFRFLHHLPDAATRGRVLGCLRKLTKGALVVSFHHPVSLHNLGRTVRRITTGRAGDRYTITVARLRREARAAGFHLATALGLRPWLREFWVALLLPIT